MSHHAWLTRLAAQQPLPITSGALAEAAPVYEPTNGSSVAPTLIQSAPAKQAGKKLSSQLVARLQSLTTQCQVMLFMKGTPQDPKCGFSSRVAHVLQESGIEYGWLDVLSQQEVREALKEWAEWPTYP